MKSSTAQSIMKWLVLVARLAIGGVFIYASVFKIPDPEAFSEAIRNYTILGPAYTNLVAITLPWVELAAGLFLISGIMIRPSALITTGLLAMFLVVLIYAYATGLDIECGCFGKESSGRITFLTVLRDASMFLVSLFILLADRGHFSILGGRSQVQA